MDYTCIKIKNIEYEKPLNIRSAYLSKCYYNKMALEILSPMLKCIKVSKSNKQTYLEFELTRKDKKFFTKEEFMEKYR